MIFVLFYLIYDCNLTECAFTSSSEVRMRRIMHTIVKTLLSNMNTTCPYFSFVAVSKQLIIRNKVADSICKAIKYRTNGDIK